MTHFMATLEKVNLEGKHVWLSSYFSINQDNKTHQELEIMTP